MIFLHFFKLIFEFFLNSNEIDGIRVLFSFSWLPDHSFFAHPHCSRNFTILIDLSLPNGLRGPFHIHFRGIAWSAFLFSPQSAFIFRGLLFHAPKRITLSISYTYNKHRLTFLFFFPNPHFSRNFTILINLALPNDSRDPFNRLLKHRLTFLFLLAPKRRKAD